MGHLVEKYTREYFTGLNSEGMETGYGVLLGGFDGEQMQLRAFDVQNLDRVNFNNAHVLEIGFGRGESIKYIMEKGAASYIGIDFAPAALELAQEYLKAHNMSAPKIYCADALDFIQNNANQIENPIDIVVMLDVIEHIPRHELTMLLVSLQKYLSKKPLVVINTPVYRHDNDVLADGLNEKNHFDVVDLSDFIEETQGMHCNKYSINSLQEFMKNIGFYNLTEFQIYGCVEELENGLEAAREYPYIQLWNKASKNGYPIQSTYLPDNLEYAYIHKFNAELLTVKDGPLNGCKFIGNLLAHDPQGDTLIGFEKYIKEGSIIFDVGAYIGLSALLFSKLTGKQGKVICFEPNKFNLLRLKNNLSLNPAAVENTSIYNIALSDQDGKSQILLSDEIDNGFASGSQLAAGGGTAIPKAELVEMGFFEETVNLITLDEFVVNTGLIPDLIKVDIEGAEVLFMKGAMKTLSKYKPVLLIELHNTFATCYVLKLLEQAGYQIQIISEEWGNRTQIVARNKGTTQQNGLLEQETAILCKEYTSYKSKLYQDNLEHYMKWKNAEQVKGNRSKEDLNYKKVSIIIPTYNRAQFISACINSVLEQTYKNIEVIVIDDGSTDNTLDLIAQINDPRLIYIQQGNQGRSHARNYGIKLASGHYITFLDSDDLYLPNKIALQVEHLKKYPQTGMIYTSAQFINEIGVNIGKFEAKCSGFIYEHVSFFTPETVMLPTVMTYKSIINEVGGFDENMQRFEDIDLWRRISKKYCIESLKESTCLLRTHTGNALKNQDLKGITKALEYYATKILSEDVNISNDIKRAGLYRFYVYYAKAMLSLYKVSLSIKLMTIAISHRLGRNPYIKRKVISFLWSIPNHLKIKTMG